MFGASYQDIEFGSPDIEWKSIRLLTSWRVRTLRGSKVYFGQKVMRGKFKFAGEVGVPHTKYYLTPDEFVQQRLEGNI